MYQENKLKHNILGLADQIKSFREPHLAVCCASLFIMCLFQTEHFSEFEDDERRRERRRKRKQKKRKGPYHNFYEGERRTFDDDGYDNFGQEVNGISRTAETMQPVITSFLNSLPKDWSQKEKIKSMNALIQKE